LTREDTPGDPAVDGTLPVSGDEAEAAARRAAGLVTGAGQLPVVDRAAYRVDGEVARGGLGRILRARDRRLERTVALKETLHGGPDLAARFVREAMVTARLQHPAIVPVYEAGRWPSGEPFYAMKLVAGRPLDALIAAAATPADRLALLPNLIAVAEALAYAHRERIIHRDLKPQNVLVGDFGETVVIDWGLAKDLADAGSGPDAAAGPFRSPAAPGETVAGAVMGTPAFMPPEQARGEPVDERADVYALGAMLYHLLAGSPPYAGATPQAVIDKVVAAAPEPVDRRQPGVPPELAAITAKAMARAPADRYPGAAAMVEELRRYQTGQLVGAHRYTAGALLRRWIRRHRAAVTAAAAIVAVAIAAVVIYLQRERTLRADAERARDDAQATLAASYVEQGRAELVAGQPMRALPFLGEAYTLGDDSDALGIMLGQALAGIVPPDRTIDVPGLQLAALINGGRIIKVQRTDGSWEYRDGHTGELLHHFDDYPGDLQGDDRSVSLENGTVRIVDLRGRVLAQVAVWPDARLHRAQLSRDHRRALLRLERADQSQVSMLWQPGGQPELVELRPASYEVTEDLAPSGRLATFASRESRDGDVTVKVWVDLWDLDTRTVRATFDGAHAVIFSPDARSLVMSRQDGTVALADTATGKVRWEVTVRKNDMPSLDWALGGTVLLACADSRLVVLSATDGAIQGELPAHECAYDHHDDHGTLLTTNALWSLRPVRRHAWLPNLGWSPFSVLRLSDDARHVSADLASGIAFWRVTDGQLVGFRPDAGWSAAYPGTLHLMRTERDRIHIETLQPGRLRALLPDSLHLSPSTRWAVSAQLIPGDNALLLWRSDSVQAVARLGGTVRTVDTIGFAPDEHSVAVIGSSPDQPVTVELYDVPAGALLRRLPVTDRPEALAWTPDSARIAVLESRMTDRSGSSTTHASIWTAGGTRIGAVDLGDGTGSSERLLAGPEGNFLVLQRTAATLIDATTAAVRARVPAPAKLELHAAAVDPATGRWALALDNGALQIWTPDLRALERQLTAANPITRMEWTASYRLVTSSDTTVQVWDTTTWDAPVTLSPGPGLRHIAAAPDGHLLAIADAIGIGLWDATAGRLLLYLDRSPNAAAQNPLVDPRTYSAAIHTLAFAPDGQTVFFEMVHPLADRPHWSRAPYAGEPPHAVIGWDLRPEQRTPDVVAALISSRAGWRLDRGRLIAQPR
jgi:WD40 repeat protein